MAQPRRPDKKKHPAKGRAAKGHPTVEISDKGDREGGMVTSASTTAPADAADDAAADQSDDDMAAFFSTGTGPAMHYDRQQAEVVPAEASSS
jgi:hypothetical protein